MPFEACPSAWGSARHSRSIVLLEGRIEVLQVKRVSEQLDGPFHVTMLSTREQANRVPR
jgi:hypothetical protein